MTDYNLGTARGTIVLQYDGSQMRQANQDLDQTRSRGESAGAAMDRVSRGMLVAGGVIAGGLAVAANSAATFEQKLSNIKAVSGATQQEMEQTRQLALKIGKDTSFSAGQAADAITELAKAGVSLHDIMHGAADATVALAAAGEVDLKEAATIASNAMNQFKLSAQDLPHVTDLLAGAANASAVDVSDLGASLSYVGPVANAVGVSIDDVSTALAVLGNNGIKGSAAGTALRSILAQLSPQTKKAKTEFKELGLITADGSNKFFDATGKIKPLNQVIGILHDSMKGLTKEQKIAFSKAAFGTEDLAAISALSAETAGSFDTMAASIGKVKAADVAKTKLDNVKGSIEQLKGSAETLGIQLGTILIPAIRSIVDHVTGAVNWFLNLSDGQQKVLVSILATAAGALLFVGALIKIVRFAQSAAATFRVLKTAMQSFALFTKIASAATKVWTAVQAAFNAVMALNPVVLIVLAIIALIAVIVLLAIKFKAVRQVLEAVWNAIKTAAVTVWNFLKEFIPAAATAIWHFLVTIFTAVWHFIVTVFTAIWHFLVTVWNTIVNVLTTVFNAIITAVTTAFNFVKNIITTIFNAIATVISTIWNAILAVIKFIIGAIVAYFEFQFNLAKTIITAVFNAIKTVIETVWNVIKAIIENVIRGIVVVISTTFETIKSIISGAWNFIVSITTTIFNTFKQIITDAINTVVGFFTGLKDKVLGALSGAGSWLLDVGKNIVHGLIEGIKSIAGDVADALLSIIPGPLKKFAGKLGIASPSKVFLGFGMNIVQGLVKGINDTKSLAGAAVNDLANRVADVGQFNGSGTLSLTNVAATTVASGAIAARQAGPNVPSGTKFGSAGGPTVVNNNYDIEVNNPKEERTSESLNRVIRRATQVGVGG